MAEENQAEEELKLKEEQDGSVVVGDDSNQHPDDEPEDDDDENEVRHASDEDDGDADAPDGETEEEKRLRRREQRLASKQRKKDFIDNLKRQVEMERRARAELENRLAVVERKSTGSEMAQLDQAEREAINAYNHFKTIHQQAIEQANGAVATEAQERMFEARKRAEQIQSIRHNVTRQQQAPQPLDPRLINHAQQWMDRNRWYDPSGKDSDSAVALTIDNRLAAEGWDPTTPEYWQELESRVTKYLPHRKNSGYNKPKREAPPVAGSGRESRAANNSSGAYKLSSERVQALKDAGLWDDPKQRADAIRRFQAYDKEQRA